ncbi:hypothetical protein B7463_g11748, partial [Scytalidium lignicola]
MDSNSGFTYKLLQGDEIRLIRIIEDGPGKPIRCTINHVSLGAKPWFVAVSYVWGDPTANLPIYIDGTPVGVTKNLESCMRHIQQLFRNETSVFGGLEGTEFWIDAVCINQGDNIEKSAQVPRMGAIYSSAKLVLGWLGENPPSEDSAIEYAFRTAKQICRAIMAGIASQQDFINGSEETPLSHRPHFQTLRESNGIDANLQTMALVHLFERQWFSRVWIIQEAVLADDRLVLMAGAYWVPCNFLEYFLDLWGSSARLTDSSDFYANMKRSSSQLMSVRTQFQELDSVTDVTRLANYLQRLLMKAFGYKSTLPQDLIYGRLGLCPSGLLPTSLSPNYDIPYPEVFHKFAMLFLKETGTLEILMTGKHELVDVPSWVPDFRYPLENTFTDVQTSSAVRVSPDGKLLVVEGTKLGEIKYISKKHNHPITGQKTVRDAVRTFHNGIVQYMSEKLRQSPEVIVREVWIRLWVQGRQGTEQQRLDSMYRFYDHFLHQNDVIAVEYSTALLGQFVTLFDAFVMDDETAGYCIRSDSTLEVGDIICSLKGLPMAAILRARLSNFIYVGPCSLAGKYLEQNHANGGREESDLLDVWNLI